MGFSVSRGDQTMAWTRPASSFNTNRLTSLPTAVRSPRLTLQSIRSSEGPCVPAVGDADSRRVRRRDCRARLAPTTKLLRLTYLLSFVCCVERRRVQMASKLATTHAELCRVLSAC